MKLLLDEMYSPDLAQALRARGHDVVAIAERPELRGRHDDAILRAATDERRVLLTENVRDFGPIAERWQAEGQAFGGLLLASSRTLPRNRAQLGALTGALDDYMSAHPGDDALVSTWEWLRGRPL